jgi:uncharacterized membrane protein YqjE
MATRRPEPDLSVEPLQPDKSLTELFSAMTSDLSTLLRKEVELAKVETREELSRTTKAGGLLAGGAVAAYLAAVFASFALAWLLDKWMPRALAFVIVAVAYAAAAAVLVFQGRRRLRQVNPVPQQTIETLKEDVQWARAQKS